MGDGILLWGLLAGLAHTSLVGATACPGLLGSCAEVSVPSMQIDNGVKQAPHSTSILWRHTALSAPERAPAPQYDSPAEASEPCHLP